MEILQNMDPYERSKLGDAVKEETYPKGTYVIREGDDGNCFYLLSEGTVEATKSMNAGPP